MRLFLALIILFALHHHLVASRPFLGLNYGSRNMWSNIRQRSTVPTVFKSVKGSRFGRSGHRFNYSPVIPLEAFEPDTKSEDELVKETEAFLNNPLNYDLFSSGSYRNIPSHNQDKIKGHSYFGKGIVPISTTTTTQLPPLFSQEDEEFLLRQLEHGFDLHSDFTKLLYPRGDDGFRKKRSTQRWEKREKREKKII